MKINTFIASILLCLLVGCKSKQGQTLGSYYQSSSPECLGVEADGSQILYVWGEGQSLEEATVMAQSNAIRAVVFDGINGGKAGCNTKPLVTRGSSDERNQAYFRDFFAKGGPYLRYLEVLQTEGAANRTIERPDHKKIRLKVRIDLYLLKKQLSNDKII